MNRDTWRTVRYGKLRIDSVLQHIQKNSWKFAKRKLIREFWNRVKNQDIRYQVKRDPFGSLIAKFFLTFPVQITPGVNLYRPEVKNVVIVDFKSLDELLEKTSTIPMIFQQGYDFIRLREQLDAKKMPLGEYCYLDLSSCDDIKQKPVPMHQHEVTVDPTCKRVHEIREEAMQKFCTDEEISFFKDCHNTFEVHNTEIPEDDSDCDPEQLEIKRLQQEKFKMLAELYDGDHYQCDDDTWERIVAYSILAVNDVNDKGEIHDLSANFSLSEIAMMGCHASAKGGHDAGNNEKGMTKNSMNVYATVDTLGLLKDCVEKGHMPIRPHTMNPKDETNKPGKKEKMFNMLDHPPMKLHYTFHGDFTDRHRLKTQLGFLMGASANGGQIDELMRLQLGMSLGKGRLTDEDLEDLDIIQSDFEGFEFNPDKHCHLALAWARMMRYGNGVKDQHGEPNRMLQVALCSEFERKILPDLRVGGVNNVYKTPCIQISGEPDTLTWNQLMHCMMVLTAQWEYNHKHDRFLAEDTGVFEAAPKNGDDGITPLTPYVEAVFNELTTHEPVKFTVEKRGKFLSTINDGKLTNEGISFCKMNFVLEKEEGQKEGLITLQREYRNMYKVVRGNKSTWDKRSCMAACINQTQNVYGQDRFYRLLDWKYRAMEKEFGKLSELGRSGQYDTRDQQGMDVVMTIDRFPTQQEVKEILYTRDPVCISQLYNSLHRHYMYNVPATGVAKF